MVAEPAYAPQVTIVVLSYNRPDLLEKALRSIAAQTCDSFEVLVIDNRSPSSVRIRDLVCRFAGVRLVANATNRGFTGGMNQGLAEARGEYVYLTEDDIELDPACVATLVDYLSRHPEAGLAGPVMWNLRDPTIRCAGGEFELRATYRMRVTCAGQHKLSATEPFHTKYLPGAMIAARTSVLRELGGFHPDFFMYGEDVELCARVRERGRAIAIVPAARVYHHEPPDAPESAVLGFHKQKNLVALYLLHAPMSVLPVFFARYAAIDGTRRLFANRRTLPVWLKAWSWAVRRSPRLLAERWRRTR
jgi:GT2 family glycosyltransferase